MIFYLLNLANMKSITKPTRIFFCKKCKHSIQSDEYETEDWFNFFDTCLICWKEVNTSWHDNNLYYWNNITKEIIEWLETIDWAILKKDILWLF